MFERISDADILRYMGAPGETAGAYAGEIERAKRLVTEAAKPRWATGAFTLEKTESGARLANTNVTLTGKAISALLAGSDECLMMAVTLGAAVDRLITRAQVSSMADAVLLDAAASAAAESVCDYVQDGLARGRALTKRYSCGYGDLPLALQPDILAALDAGRRAGIACGAGHLMNPVKSVTAIMGVTAAGGAAFDARAYCMRRNECGGDCRGCAGSD